MLPLAEQIKGIYFNKEEKGLYTNNVERIDPISIAKYMEKANKDYVIPESVCNTCM